MSSEAFGKIYPFTTENISCYFPLLDMKDKSVLTVGSSLDQAFNALVLGAKSICVYDINEMTFKYFKNKRELVLTKNREDFCMAVFQIKDLPFLTWMTPVEEIIKRNIYLQSDLSYEILRNRLEEVDINFVCGDIFSFDDYLENISFDRMIFSNVLSYIDLFAGKQNDMLEFLSNKFCTWDKHLNDNGLLQFLYYYNFGTNYYNERLLGSVTRIEEVLDKKFYLKCFDATYDRRKQDAILVYHK